MKLILKILKWIGTFLAGIILLLIVSGACYRLFSSKPVPPGKLVDVNGTKLHIRAEGKKNDLPTVILEAGANSHTDMLHWIAEGLKKNMRVIRLFWFLPLLNNIENLKKKDIERMVLILTNKFNYG